MLQNLYGLGDYTFKQIRELAEFVKKEGRDPTLLYYRRPDAADDLNFVTKIPLEEIAFIVPDAFSEPKGRELARRLTLEQLEVIGAGGDAFLRVAIAITLKNIARSSPEDAQVRASLDYISHSPAWQ